MRKLATKLTFITILLTGLYTSIKAQPDTVLSGNWVGELIVLQTKIRLVMKLSYSNDTLAGWMDSPDQGAKDIKMDEVSFISDTLRFRIKRIGASYTGVLLKNDTVIKGTFRQGREFTLVFVKTDNPPRILRPQEPRPPFPYKSEDVVFLNKKAGIELAGTLTIPETAGPFPVVVLVSGSGPQDRNEEILGHKPFLVIADYLTRNDIAVLRYDDRGTGSSSGIYPLSTTEDFALDATAAVEYLKNRSDIDPEKIGIIGHSEGAMIAAMVAAKRKDIAFIVMMAGPGVVGEELLYMQTEAVGRSEKMPDDEIKELLDVTKHIYEIVKNEKDNEKAARQIRDYYTEISEGLSKEEKEKKGYTFVYVSATIGQVTSQWFRYFLEFDPCRDIKKVKCPVLAMNGEKDLQVPYEANLETIKTLLQKAGTAKNKTIMIEGVNHLFQTCETGLPSEYATIPETVSPKAMLSMYEWIRTVID